MNIFAIADLHLSIGCPEKDMGDPFPLWKNYMQRIEKNWRDIVSPEDLVLLAGDITWASGAEEALPDLLWIDRLPGQKIMIKGNHDYWWGSASKLRSSLPQSIRIIHNDALSVNDVSIGGSRLWDTEEYNCSGLSEYVFNPKENKKAPKLTPEQIEKIYTRELGRLEISLAALRPDARIKIAMTHYPPIGPDLRPSRAHLLFKKYGVDICIFGHLHHVIPTPSPPFGESEGIRYLLTSADHLDFKPLKII